MPVPTLSFRRTDTRGLAQPNEAALVWFPTAHAHGEPHYLWSPDAALRVERHAASSNQEVAGLLAGRAWEDDRGRVLVAIEAAIPAIDGVETSGVHVSFRPEAWDSLSGQVGSLGPDTVLVGWFHTHPGLGAFFSGTDRRTQAAAFREPWQLGLVIDPVTGGRLAFRGADCTPVDVSRFASGTIQSADHRTPAAKSRAPYVTGGGSESASAVAPSPVDQAAISDPSTSRTAETTAPTRWWLDRPATRWATTQMHPRNPLQAALKAAMAAHRDAVQRRDRCELGGAAYEVASQEVSQLEVTINAGRSAAAATRGQGHSS